MLKPFPGFLVASVLLCIAIGPARSSARVLTDAGESAKSNETLSGDAVAGKCSHGSVRTAQFTSTGTATGTYPGTYTASGSWTLSTDGSYESFDESFVINSGSLQIKGTVHAVDYTMTMRCHPPTFGPNTLTYKSSKGRGTIFVHSIGNKNGLHEMLKGL